VLGEVLVCELPGLVRRGTVLPGQKPMVGEHMSTPDDPDATQEFDPFEDEDQDNPVPPNPFPYLPPTAILP
jgi:hypothetical protein